MTRSDVIARAKAILAEAYEEAAEMVVLYLEDHPSEHLQSLCKEIDPDNWSALDARVRRARARKASVDAGSLPTRAVSGSSVRHARSSIRRDPAAVVDALDDETKAELVNALVPALKPQDRRSFSVKLDQEAGKQQLKREQAARDKEREHLGDETVDGLALKEELQSTEYLLIKARGNIRGFVQHLGELGQDVPGAWRESCLDWVNDLEGHLGMAKALLAGDEIDWSRFEELLEKGA